MPRKAAFFGAAWFERLLAACSGFGANLAELLTELVDSTRSIDDLVLARIKRVRFGRDFDFDQRLLLAFELDGLARLDGRTGQKFEVARQVVHHNVPVLGVNAFFHCSLA